MRPWLAIWPVFWAVLLLGGCNMVHTDHPLFTAADAVGAPTFRPGVWAAPDPHCDFDPNQPVKAWPQCAHGDSMLEAEKGVSMMLVPGAPMIIQFASNKPEAGSTAPQDYFYVAIDPLRRDAAGRIVAMNSWAVACGPPRRGAHSNGPRGTLHPWPGMTMDPDGNNCTAASAAVVRTAAVLSRPRGAPNGVYWVRDGAR